MSLSWVSLILLFRTSSADVTNIVYGRWGCEGGTSLSLDNYLNSYGVVEISYTNPFAFSF
jgi:hypothetical protein